MALFSNLDSIKPIAFKTAKEKPKEKEPTLLELAEEKFGDNRRLIMWIEKFLSQKRQIRQLPSRLAWQEQLKILESHPEAEREKEVRRCIAGDYRQIAYEYKPKKYKKSILDQDISMEKQDEEDLNYEAGF